MRCRLMIGLCAGLLGAGASELIAQTWQGSGTAGDTSTGGATTLYTNTVNWSGATVPATSGVTTAIIDFGNAGLVDLTGTRSLGSGAGSVGDLTVLDATVTNGAIQIGALGGKGSLLVSNSTMYSGLFLAQSNGSSVTATIIDSVLNFSNSLIELSRPMASGHIATSRVVVVNSTLIGSGGTIVTPTIGFIRSGEGVGSPGVLSSSALILSNSTLRDSSIRLGNGYRLEAVNSLLTNVDFVAGSDMRLFATNSIIWTRSTAGGQRIAGLNTAVMQLDGGLLRVNNSLTVGGTTANERGVLVLLNSTNANRVTGSLFTVGGSVATADGKLAMTNSFLQVVTANIGIAASGTVHLANSFLKAETLVRFGSNSLFSAKNSTIEFSDGTFDNRMIDTANWEGATNITLRALNVSLTNRLEAASIDSGANDGAFANNFALGTLILSNHPCCSVKPLQLINAFDNNPSFAVPEAVYVHELFLGNNTILDLNGINLYTFDFTQGAGSSVINGSVTIVTIPEAGTGVLVLTTLGVCALMRSRKR